VTEPARQRARRGAADSSGEEQGAPFSDQEVDAAIEALSEEGRFQAAERRVARLAPQLQRILAAALNEGGWFGPAHESQIREAAGAPEEADRRRRISTLLAEETRMGMLVGVVVGWELALELELRDEHTGGR
jgi:hypothetical protein